MTKIRSRTVIVTYGLAKSPGKSPQSAHEDMGKGVEVKLLEVLDRARNGSTRQPSG